MSEQQQYLEKIIANFKADSGTVHMIGKDGALHLKASSGVPEVVLNIVRIVPIGKGMAGLCAERAEPITACNIQSDADRVLFIVDLLVVRRWIELKRVVES